MKTIENLKTTIKAEKTESILMALGFSTARLDLA